jgi:hypothetical protein
VSRKRTRHSTSPRRKRPNRATRTMIPRRGMPTPDSVQAVVPFTSPTGRTYRILKTTERDAYDDLRKPSKTRQPGGRRILQPPEEPRSRA